MKAVFPIILTPAETGYVVTVPDLSINTQGASVEDAIFMARDAISLWGNCEEDAGRPIPEPSTLTPSHTSDEIATLVDVDFDAYRRQNERRTIRKNVTLPSWLCAKAEAEGVNFSGVLQEALYERLGINGDRA